MTATRTIAVGTHGRYLVAGAESADAPLLVGFHGYAEGVDSALERLLATAGASGWTLVAIEALHRFYRGRSQDVVASWMTRQDRDLMIADNVAYVDAVIQAVHADRREHVAYAGFSQGAAMAFRSACLGAHAVAAVVTLGGDVPPELTPEQLRRAPAVLLGRNEQDEWYTAARFVQDQERLRSAGVPLTAVTVGGGHDWTEAFSRAAGEFLQTLR
jgi:predicted esterase